MNLEHPSGHLVRVRDQRPMVRAGIDAHLDGIGLGEWLSLLNDRVFFFARQKDLTTLLARYQAEGQDVVVLDTARLLAAAGGRVEVTTVSPGAPEGWSSCRCRGRDTFVPLAEFTGTVADIMEVTVLGGLGEMGALVRRVVRHHPDQPPEVLVGR